MQKLLRINYLTSFILLFALGINILIFNEKLYKFVVLLILIFISLDVIKHTISLITKKNKNINDLMINLLIIILLIIMFNNKYIPYSIFPFLLGVYIVLNGIIKLPLTYVLFINNARGKITNLILSLLFLSAGITLMFSPLMHLNIVLVIIGLYTILLSINYLYDYFRDLNKSERGNLKRKIRIPLPILLEALVPYTFLTFINKHLNNDQEEIKLKDIKKDDKPDMEIFIHVTEKGNGKMGHVDLLFDNEVISYGNYDCETVHFFGTMGDGVMFKTSKEEYIKFCINNSKKTLFGYGLKLDEKQKDAVRKKIKELDSILYKWKPNKKIDSYGNRLLKSTKAKFFKFKKGRFKKFFLLGNNCALFADRIIGATGSDILKINGIITPGTYQKYLDDEFNKKNSMVITRTIYNDKSINNLSNNN